jgi:uncharacterized protein (TIGR03032 family)
MAPAEHAGSRRETVPALAGAERSTNSAARSGLAPCPGFARGLALHDGHAMVGLSLPRQHRDFSGLLLDDRLRESGEAAQCLVQTIDLAAGRAVEWLRIGGVVRELYDIALIPGVRTPMVVGFAQGQINRLINRGRAITLDEL